MKLDHKYLKDIGLYLKDARKEAGMTQQEFTEAVGLTSNQYISNIERGKCIPSDDIISSAIAIYKLDADDVVDMLQDAYCSQLEARFL